MSHQLEEEAKNGGILKAYRPQYEIAAERIISHIIATGASGGDRLPTEYGFGEMLGISRSIVREAVKYLSAIGLVGVRKGYGLYVGERTESLARVQQIAEAAGISIFNALNILNNESDVASDIRVRVEQIARQQGYPLARGSGELRHYRKVVDLVVTGVSYYYDIAIIESVARVLELNKKRLALSVIFQDFDREQEWLEQVTNGSTEGVILVLSAATSTRLDALSQHHIPFVVIDSSGEVPATVPSVGTTNWAGGRVATEHLIRLGHKRIATIAGDVSYLSTQARMAGYRAALDAANIPADSAYVRTGNFLREDGYTQTLALLDLPTPPTAIFAGNDALAFGVYEALRERGVKIPQEMSVVGFDNEPHSVDMSPPLTTINHPLTEMGTFAANMLLKLMDGEQPDSTRIEVSTSLVERESCAAPDRP